MKHELAPSWSAEQQAAGEQLRQVWEQAFSAAETADDAAAQRALGGAASWKTAQVRARHEAELLRYPNVIGLAEGIKMKRPISAQLPRREPGGVVQAARETR